MSSIIDRLKADHATVSRLLDLLEAQLENVREAKKANFALMRDILDYVSRYPDAVHEVALEKMLARNAGSQSSVGRLQRDQQALAEKARKILDEVASVVDGNMVPRQGIEDRAADYIETYRAHLAFEDGELLPLVERTLTDDDWTAVAAWQAASEDPVFGKVLENDFESLYAYIQRESD